MKGSKKRNTPEKIRDTSTSELDYISFQGNVQPEQAWNYIRSLVIKTLADLGVIEGPTDEYIWGFMDEYLLLHEGKQCRLNSTIVA